MGRRRGRATEALVASLVVHFLVVAMAWRRWAAAPIGPPPVDSPVAIEIAVEPSIEPFSPLAPPAPGPSRSEQRVKPTGRRSALPVAAPPVGKQPQSTGAPAVPSAAPPGPVDLSFNGLSMAAKARATGPEATDAAVTPVTRESQHGRLSVEELRAAAERQADAAANVRQGRAHPVLYDFLRDARARLEGEASKLAETLPLGPSATVRGWGRGYLERVRQHPGARHPSRNDAAEDSRIDPHADALGQYNEAGRQAEMGGEQRTAGVCVDVQPGKPVVVRLKQSSHNADLDRLAVDGFERAGALRPVPAEVAAGVACYTVAIAAFRVPPSPSLGFGLKNGRPEVIYPLKRITKVTVELKSVDYGPKRGPPNLLR